MLDIVRANEIAIIFTDDYYDPEKGEIVTCTLNR